MKKNALLFRCGLLAFIMALSHPAMACDTDSVALFGCEAANSKKYIELCSPSPLDAETGWLQYRFGALDEEGEEASVELEYPAERAGSLQKFFAATYTHRDVYTQSVRFVSGGFDYIVYTRAQGMETIDAGVKVRERKSGKTSVVHCSERPRFYIHDLQGLVACDPETPVGKVCVK